MEKILNKIKDYLLNNLNKSIGSIMISLGSYLIITFTLMIEPLSVLLNGGNPDWGSFYTKDLIAFGVFFGVFIRGIFGKEKEK